MTPEDRLRRVVILCSHFVRNRAYYLAGWDGKALRKRDEFWITVNGNFMDVAVLEWCKLFADEKGEHFWGHVVTDPKAFGPALLAAIGSTPEEFEALKKEMRTYRDKFVAHLDREPIMNIPHLSSAAAATHFYHAHVVAKEAKTDVLKGLPMDLTNYEQEKSKEALEKYKE